jgi:hypothetical protein
VQPDRLPGQRAAPEPAPTPRRSVPDRLFTTALRILDGDRVSRRRIARQGLVLGAFLGAGLLALLPVLRATGWPGNHEDGAIFARTAIYAQHLRHLDFLPVWSDSDAYGMGTPMPAGYHKLFFWVAGGLSLVGWTLKAAVVTTLLAVLLVGMYGMRRCLLRLGVPSLLASVGGIALAVAPYTFTDWYTRGDLAEFTGMMLVPWILCWSVDMVAGNKVSFWIVPLILVTFLADDLVAYLGLILTAGAFLAALLTNPGRRRLVRRYGSAMLACGVAIAPFLLLKRAFDGDYDINGVVPTGLALPYDLHPLREYFLPGNFDWAGPDPLSMTVTVGLALWVGLAVVLVWRAGQWLSPEPGITVQAFLRRPEVLLAGVVVVAMAVQVPAIAGTHRLPVVHDIAPVWRLEAFITPALIALVVSMGWRCVSNRPSAALLGAGGAALMVLGLVVSSPVTDSKPGTVDLGAYTPARIQSAGSGLGNLLLTNGGYLPVVHAGAARESTGTVYNTYEQLASNNGGLTVLRGPCQVEAEARTFEASVRSFQVDCTGPGTVALPISFNSFSTVRWAGRSVPYHRIDRDPRMVVEFSRGTGRLTVELPTVWRVLRGSMP